MSEKKRTEITIGADPEYGFISNGGIVSASGCVRGSEGEFGVDGCGRVAELRPPYSTSPTGLVDNIYTVLKNGHAEHEAIRAFRWKAGGMACDEPIGGHIHFGHSKLCQGAYQAKLGLALDRTLAVLCLMVEDGEEALNRRIGSNYGSLGGSSSYRPQTHGVEYRVLASWLTSPEDAKAILSLAYLIASYFDNEDVMDEAGSIPGFDNQSFRECDKIGLMYYIPPIIKFIRNLPAYEKYEKEISHLFRLIKNQKIWACEGDMKETWGLSAVEMKKKTVRKEVELV